MSDPAGDGTGGDPIRLYSAQCGWRCGNAGDECARDIVRWLSGQVVTQTDHPQTADLAAVGSVAQNLGRAFAGHVWGVGLMFDHVRVETPLAKVHALRGPLTARRWEGLERRVPLGDPGLLAADAYSITREMPPRYRVGLVPHYSDGDLLDVREWARAFCEEVTVIDICGRPRDVLEQMARCEHILSSSLHGLVFADSLGVPNNWVILSDRVQGGGFKFRDYYATFGVQDPLPACFHATARPSDIVGYPQEARRYGIGSVKRDLRETFPFPRTT